MQSESRITLYYSDIATGGTSDKEYRVQIEKSGSGHVVNFQFGRRGGTMQSGTKTTSPVPLVEAQSIYSRLVAEKQKNGYKPEGEYACAGPTAPAPRAAQTTDHPVELLEEVSEDVCESLLRRPEYWLQVKVDGHRRQIAKTPAGIVSYNKKGTAVSLPSETVDELQRLPLKSFLLDGELIGNAFVAFDILKASGKSLTDWPYAKRFEHLETLLHGGTLVTTVRTWKTNREKTLGMSVLRKNNCEGAAFKLTTAAYASGLRGNHKKFKFVKSCTCKVIRTYDKGHESATLVLRDGHVWREVGRASLIGKDSRITVGSFVEVLFLYATEGGRLYQPRIKELRTDADATDCSMSQLRGKYKEGVREAA